MNEGGVYSLEEFTSICHRDEIFDDNAISLLYRCYIAEILGTLEDIDKEYLAYYYYMKMKIEHRLN